MKIALEATLAQTHKTGTGKYVYHLLKTLSEIDKENEYFLLYDNKDWSGPNFGVNFLPVSYSSAANMFTGTHALTKVLKKIKPDIYHATRAISIPPIHSYPVVSTIHDIYPILDKSKQSSFISFFSKEPIKCVVEYSDFFLFNSMFTKLEFSIFFNVPDTKGQVIYLGPSVKVEPIESKDKSGNFMICPSGIEKRREQLFLLDVYKELFYQNKDIPNLIFIGDDRGEGGELARRIKDFKLENKVIWEKDLPRDEIINYYKKASLFLLPSSYEGFGIPLAEAMFAHIPVICSDISVFREVARDYPVAYARLRDKSDWIEQINRFYKKSHKLNIKTADKLLEERNWQTCASKTLNCYKSLV